MSTQTFDEFQKQFGPPAPPRTIRLSREVGAGLRQAFGLSADAPVEEIAQKLDDLGKEAKDQEAEHKVIPVGRGADALKALVRPATRMPTSLRRAAPRSRSRR